MMAELSKKELSKYLSSELDQHGFDRRRIRERIHVNNLSSRAKDISTKRILQTDDIEKIHVGSQREGIGLQFFNDIDILQINHGMACVNGKRTNNTSSKLVFQMEQRNAPAGYTFLKLLSQDTSSEKFEQIRYALVKKKKGTFLSSQLFMTRNDDVFNMGDSFLCKRTHYKPPHGPSIPKYVEDGFRNKLLSLLNLTDTEMDFVRAFPCHAGSVLQEWGKRDRKHGWPSPKTIAHVMKLPTYVVPVGKKESVNKDLQWRISFIMAEIHLVQAFNNTQTKVFVLLKLIAKYMLQPISKEISSYVVKTVMLWLAEKIPKKKFRQTHLIARLVDALVFLKTAVENRHLPSYMIPKQNLFANRLPCQQQKALIAKLHVLIESGNQMVIDYIFSKHAHEEDISSVCASIYSANLLDKIGTCLTAMFTTQQLAHYFWRAFYMSARWKMVIYHILFNMGPFLLYYGIRGFPDPLTLDLCQQFAESERKELDAIKQEMRVKEQMAVSRQTPPIPEWSVTTTTEKKKSLFLENLVYLLLYSVIFVTYLTKIWEFFHRRNCLSNT